MCGIRNRKIYPRPSLTPAKAGDGLEEAQHDVAEI